MSPKMTDLKFILSQQASLCLKYICFSPYFAFQWFFFNMGKSRQCWESRPAVPPTGYFKKRPRTAGRITLSGAEAISQVLMLFCIVHTYTSMPFKLGIISVSVPSWLLANRERPRVRQMTEYRRKYFKRRRGGGIEEDPSTEKQRASSLLRAHRSWPAQSQQE